MPGTGTSIWDKDVFKTLGLHKVKILTDNLPHYRFNEAFMAFAALGLAFNVVTRSACILLHTHTFNARSKAT